MFSFFSDALTIDSSHFPSISFFLPVFDFYFHFCIFSIFVHAVLHVLVFFDFRSPESVEMSDTNDSQNMSSDMPHAGDTEKLVSSDSSTESSSPMVLEALRVDYPPGWEDGMGDSAV